MCDLVERGGCSSVGRAGRLVIERLLVQILAQGKAELHVEVPEQDTEPLIAHQWGPCDELATCPGSTLPSPWDKAGIGSSSNTPKNFFILSVTWF